MSKFEPLDMPTDLDAAAVRAEFYLMVASSYRPPAWTRLTCLAILRADADGVATFAPGEVVDLLGIRDYGGEQAASRILGRAVRGGYARKGSTTERIMLSPEAVVLWHRAEEAERSVPDGEAA